MVFSRDPSGATTGLHLFGPCCPPKFSEDRGRPLAPARPERREPQLAGELWRMSAREMAQAIRNRQASSREVVEAHLRRIEGVNPSINAVVIVMAEQALEAANVADHAVAAGADLPPLHGVPFTIKENIDVAGTPTTQEFQGAGQRLPESGCSNC